MDTYKVVHGIKLYERKCKMCTVHFFIPKSHPQAYCSEVCADDAEGRKPFGKPNKKRGAKRKLKYVLKRSDYEKS